MIIWISGPYGVGKSTLAEAMIVKMKKAIIFDAEEVGNAVRNSYPNCPFGYIFEDYPLWGEFCYQLLKDIHNNFNKDIIVPMTLLREDSYKIIQNIKLSMDGTARLPGFSVCTTDVSVDDFVQVVFNKLGINC